MPKTLNRKQAHHLNLEEHRYQFIQANESLSLYVLDKEDTMCRHCGNELDSADPIENGWQQKLIETVRERTQVSFNCGECQRRMYMLQRKEKALKQKELFLQTFINRCGVVKKQKSVQYEVVVVGVKSNTKKIKVENEMGDEDDDVLVTAVEEAS
ncbi:unnamed protein product [Mytilus edulis]|uniref:Uncharacterized protein n=1 Tax=Mytilus edulis TaxID=6550 RepID=A0A8S3T4N3_MYTED|nr:unnamed protein product [Mytilus edulis]